MGCRPVNWIGFDCCEYVMVRFLIYLFSVSFLGNHSAHSVSFVRCDGEMKAKVSVTLGFSSRQYV